LSLLAFAASVGAALLAAGLAALALAAVLAARLGAGRRLGKSGDCDGCRECDYCDGAFHGFVSLTVSVMFGNAYECVAS
jgi:hypothetical protein